jgi:hypothetical protein
MISGNQRITCYAAQSNYHVFGVRKAMSHVPDAAKAQIRAKAAADWPDDFEMQKYTIEKQVEAYLEMEAFRIKFNTDEFVSPILAFASKNWPGDYEMELHTFEKQLDAGITFFDLKAPDVPTEVFENIKLNAFAEWPDDHEMKLLTLEKQLDAWRSLQDM